MNDQKHLGPYLTPAYLLKNTVMKKSFKAKKIGEIKHLSIFLSHKTLNLMYKALVRPHLDYCDNISYTIKTDSGCCDLKFPDGKN